MVDIATKYSIQSGGFGSTRFPLPIAGKSYYPPHVVTSNYTLALTANLMYAIPFPVERTTTYAGLKIFNSGVADNGVTLRAGVYAEAAAGGPGALQVDSGIITLTGASAIRTAAAPVTLVGPAVYFLVLVSGGTPTMYCFSGTSTQDASTNIATVNNNHGLFGNFSGPIQHTFPVAGQIAGDSGAFTFAALPATAPAMTATILASNSSTHALGGTFPQIMLYA